MAYLSMKRISAIVSTSELFLGRFRKIKTSDLSTTMRQLDLKDNDVVTWDGGLGVFLGKSAQNTIAQLSATSITFSNVDHASGVDSTIVTGAREVTLFDLSNISDPIIVTKVVVNVKAAFDGPNVSVFSIGNDTAPTEFAQSADVNLAVTGIYEKNIWRYYQYPNSSSLGEIKVFFPDDATIGELDLFICYQIGLHTI